VRLEVIIKNACLKFIKENLKITLAVVFFFIASKEGFLVLEIILLMLSLIGLVGFFLIRRRIITENEIFLETSQFVNPYQMTVDLFFVHGQENTSNYSIEHLDTINLQIFLFCICKLILYFGR